MRKNSLFLWLLIIVCNLIFTVGDLKFLFAQDKTIAVVNNEIITQRDLDNLVNFMRVQVAEEHDDEAALENKIQAMKQDLIQRLIEDRLVLQEAKKQNITIDESRIKAKIAELKKRYPSENDFQQALKQQGLSEADLENRIREQALMYNVIDRFVRSQIVVSPAEITDYYNKKITDFMLPQQRDFQSIAVDNIDLAKQIYESLKSGKAMEDVAKEFNVTVNNLSAAKGELKKELEDILFNLGIAMASEPVKIKDSYYIFRLNKISEPRQQTLAEVRTGISNLLYENKLQAGMVKWIGELKNSAYIKMSSEQKS